MSSQPRNNYQRATWWTTAALGGGVNGLPAGRLPNSSLVAQSGNSTSPAAAPVSYNGTYHDGKGSGSA